MAAKKAASWFLYFAYGSNLLRERLVLKNPTAKFHAVGRLKDFKLVFVGNGERWHGGIASIRETEKDGGEVWGVVWQIDNSDLPNLDEQEEIYTPMEVEVTDAQGERYLCRTYQLRLSGHWAEETLPSPHYKDVILRGARQNGLPASYIQSLHSHPDNHFKGKLPVYDSVLALLSHSQKG